MFATLKLKHDMYVYKVHINYQEVKQKINMDLFLLKCIVYLAWFFFSVLARLLNFTYIPHKTLDLKP